VYIGFGWGNLRDPGIDGNIILRWIFRSGGSIEWIDLIQDTDRWRALINMLMNLLVP
jgi:hypothetical protein